MLKETKLLPNTMANPTSNKMPLHKPMRGQKRLNDEQQAQSNANQSWLRGYQSSFKADLESHRNKCHLPNATSNHPSDEMPLHKLMRGQKRTNDEQQIQPNANQSSKCCLCRCHGSSQLDLDSHKAMAHPETLLKEQQHPLTKEKKKRKNRKNKCPATKPNSIIQSPKFHLQSNKTQEDHSENFYQKLSLAAVLFNRQKQRVQSQLQINVNRKDLSDIERLNCAAILINQQKERVQQLQNDVDYKYYSELLKRCLKSTAIEIDKTQKEIEELKRVVR